MPDRPLTIYQVEYVSLHFFTHPYLVGIRQLSYRMSVASRVPLQHETGRCCDHVISRHQCHLRAPSLRVTVPVALIACVYHYARTPCMPVAAELLGPKDGKTRVGERRRVHCGVLTAPTRPLPAPPACPPGARRALELCQTRGDRIFYARSSKQGRLYWPRRLLVFYALSRAGLEGLAHVAGSLEVGRPAMTGVAAQPSAMHTRHHKLRPSACQCLHDHGQGGLPPVDGLRFVLTLG